MGNIHDCVDTAKNLTVLELEEFDVQRLTWSSHIRSIDIDFSNNSFINEIWGVKDAEEILIKTLVFLPVVLWGVLANIFLLYVIYDNPNLRSPINLVIGNMAAADFASLLFHPWIFLTYDFFQNYQLGSVGCKFEAAMECSILLTSVASICAISYDRLTAIVLPQQTRMTKKCAKIAMAVTWVGGICAASPLIVYRNYKERVWLDFVEKYCTENVIVINIYWHVIITMLFWIPLLIMSICYVAIYIKLNRYGKKVAKYPNPIHVSYKIRVVKSMIIVVITFMLCRLPFTALIFYRNQLLKTKVLQQTNTVQNQVNGLYYYLWFASKFLIVFNAGLNPLIYGLTNEKFRRAFNQYRIFRMICPCCMRNDARCTAPTPPHLVMPNKKTHETVLNDSISPRYRLFTIFRSKHKITDHDNIKVAA